jgi:hypothetical protein
MGGSAQLGDNLIDDLVEDVDTLRGDLNADFGTRPFRCFTVLRSWTGEQQGEGDFSDVVNEILPAPRVTYWDTYFSAYTSVMTPLGVHEDGNIKLDEISLTYTYDELSPHGLRLNQQFFFVLREIHGQNAEPRFLKQRKPPFADREKSMGWLVILMDWNLPSNAHPELPE